MTPQAMDTAPRGEDVPLLVWCPKQDGWQMGVFFEGRWVDYSTLELELEPTHWLKAPPDLEEH
jgi:hypothetical protein